MAEKITVYHGSRAGLQGAIRPDMSDGACDFGAGFYVGTDSDQPRTLICRGESPTLYTLSLELDGLKVHRFEPNAEWALFVAYNRGKLEQYRDYAFYRRFAAIRAENDVIFGKIANDRLFTTLSMFFDGTIADVALVKSLSALNIGDQYCLTSAKACAQLTIVDEKRFVGMELERIQQRSDTQKRRAASESERLRREFRREGEFFDEILERMTKSGEGC